MTALASWIRGRAQMLHIILSPARSACCRSRRPHRGVIALASVAFLALTLVLRLRTTRACTFAPRT